MIKSWKSEYISGVNAELSLVNKSQDGNLYCYLATIKVAGKECHYAISASNYESALATIDLEMNEFMSAYYASQIIETIRKELFKDQPFIKEAKLHKW